MTSAYTRRLAESAPDAGARLLYGCVTWVPLRATPVTRSGDLRAADIQRPKMGNGSRVGSTETSSACLPPAKQSQRRRSRSRHQCYPPFRRRSTHAGFFTSQSSRAMRSVGALMRHHWLSADPKLVLSGSKSVSFMMTLVVILFFAITVLI